MFGAVFERQEGGRRKVTQPFVTFRRPPFCRSKTAPQHVQTFLKADRAVRRFVLEFLWHVLLVGSCVFVCLVLKKLYLHESIRLIICVLCDVQVESLQPRPASAVVGIATDRITPPLWREVTMVHR